MVTIPSVAITESTSSGSGMSFYMPFLGCARKAALERKMGLTPVPDADGYVEEEELVQLGKRRKLNQTKIGVIYHKMLECYHGEQECEFVYEDGVGDLEYAEALRVFKEYIKHYRPDFFGKLLATEEFFSIGAKLPDKESAALEWLEAQDKRIKAVDLLGVPFFTGRRDVRFEVTPDAHDMLLRIGADVGPGMQIIVDHKTKAREDGFLASWAAENAQMQAYMMASKALGLPIAGAVLSISVFTKVTKKNPDGPKFKAFWLPFPDKRQQAVVRYLLSWAEDMRQRYGEDYPNPTHCFDYFKQCPFFMKQCDLAPAGWESFSALTGQPNRV